MPAEVFDSHFEIMNPNAKGYERLFNEEERTKLKGLEKNLKDFLTDLTAEENDIKYGYINGSNTAKVTNQGNLMDSKLKLMGNITNNLMA